MKKIWVFLLGMLAGFVLAFVVLICAAKIMNTSSVSGITMMEQPGEIIEAESFEVFQVISNGALATAGDDFAHLGTVVFFPSEDGNTYYDDQIIKVPAGMHARQIGTYRYETKESYKTVPIVKIMK